MTVNVDSAAKTGADNENIKVEIRATAILRTGLV